MTELLLTWFKTSPYPCSFAVYVSTLRPEFHDNRSHRLTVISLSAPPTAISLHDWHTNELAKPGVARLGLSLACAWPGWGARCMNYLPASHLFAWLCIGPSLRITSVTAAAWALTTLCSVMHCNLQTSLRRDEVRKKPSPSCSQLNSFPPFQFLTPHVPPALCYPLHSPVLLSSISPPSSSSLFTDMPACASTSSLLQFNLQYVTNS